VGIQTVSPENPVIKFACNQDYENYYSWALEQRKTGKYPPFSHLLLLTCSYASSKSAQKVAQEAKDEILKLNINNVRVDGPAASFYERHGNQYRWQLLVRSKKRGDLVKIASQFESNRKWTVNLDPISLL
jgi:primosomal protein N' (replication factor Y)